MIEEPKLLTIRRDSPRPTKQQLALFQGSATGLVEDAMGGGAALDHAIKPVCEDPIYETPVVGPALTADNGPADILATLAAVSFLKPGDVLVSAFGAYQGCAAAGDLVSGMMKNKGAAGFITDGPMRDIAGIRAVGLPSWCTGLTPASPFSKGPGRVGLPIQIGGRTVKSGDLVIADRDGVVVVPYEQIDVVGARLQEIREMESALESEVVAGLTAPENIRELLVSDQVEYVD